VASGQSVRCKFPSQQNRKLFRRCRKFWRRNREFFLSKQKSTPDEIFGTHNTNALKKYGAFARIITDEPGEKEQAIMDCITAWLQARGRLDKDKEADPQGTMDKTYQFSGPPEMENFLKGISACLNKKHYAYNYAKNTITSSHKRDHPRRQAPER
jgi:hypothetical protein